MPGSNDFRFVPFSRRQVQAMTWWRPGSPAYERDAIVCDGSVRAGKTLALSLGFVQWAMLTFDGEILGMCGKTVGSLRRNVTQPLKRMLRASGYSVEERIGESYLRIGRGGRSNTFYLFGGRDESSQELIAGSTLAGCLFDEAALMPESFVNMATSRCSVEGSRYWFNCNPGGPFHWFKREWVDNAERKNALHLPFVMDDNPSLSERTKARYRAMYSGVWYQRYIEGRWVAAEGLIFDMWDAPASTFDEEPLGLRATARRYVAVDYGTQNATVFLECLDDGKTLWITREWRHSGRETGHQRTDEQYADAMDAFVGDRKPLAVIVDPSAASFKTTLRSRSYRVMDAVNDVQDGIRLVATLMTQRRLRVHSGCHALLKGLAGYVWDPKALERGIEQPLKQDDHECDAARYLARTIVNDYRAHRQSA